ncbi:unnamed protein product [Adineta steineri]|uniref:UPAR/Ly6 domain-containing protein qvr n=1 Tax=Adineta steineri TaxID=433720 RepID=A0A814XC02_9BILA|nr:unnamed protein product [Adineta steineri]CAF1214384.1 unnamed protein product [Adineta steineri]CAF1217026.1 unnamed protein product [Adineta steineri]CAF3528742.1 unnamed protein product [Adineta steineri]CAF3694129.1 unnamed protein product [Adineta steineri]
MNLIFIIFFVLIYIQQIPVDCIQCYQCSSEEDEFCPAFGKFDETKNALVDCFSLESYVPGHMCMKMVKESYDTFYAKGWKTVIRSCASRSTLGVAQGCRYFVDEVGLEVAVCYCENRDGCNGSSINLHSILLLTLTLFAVFFIPSNKC